MKIQRVACVGAGLIGQGWATLFAARGLDVVLHDVDSAVLGASTRVIRENLTFLEESGFLEKGMAAPSFERIETTEAKARAVRPQAEHLITLAKRGDLHARRLAARDVQDQETLHKLFDELAERYEDREGGYTRIYKLGPRKGDAAPMVLISLVE